MTENSEVKLDSLIKDFELFAHIASHDLRDPLRQALYNLDDLKKNKGDNAELIEGAQDCINEVLSKIALLREYSHLINCKKEFEKVDLNEVLAAVLGDLREKINASNAEINYKKLPVIIGNEGHLVMLFKELVDNSIKFKGDDVTKIDVSCEQHDGVYKFIIKDNGVGIEEFYRELIFGLFQRLNPEIKDGSYGVGLAFARKIVENHGGKIWFDTGENEDGVRFHFILDGAL